MVTALDERRTSAVIGIAVTVLVVAAVVLLIEWRSGGFDEDYELVATFDSVGQFFRVGSEVNVRGVTVGEVASIALQPDNRAEVRLSIDGDQRIAADTEATIRGKSLLGPKFLELAFDPLEDGQRTLADGDRISKTTNATELEPVLTHLHDFLEAVDPRELSTVIGTLETASRDQGEVFGRVVDNGGTVADVLASRDPALRSALDSLAVVTEELASHSQDIRTTTAGLNELLPAFEGRGEQLAGLLDSTAALSADVSALLTDNAETISVLVGNGGRVLGMLDTRNADVAPTVYALARLLVGINEVVSLPVPGAGIAYRDQAVLPNNICDLFALGDGGGAEPERGPYTGRGVCAGLPEAIEDILRGGDPTAPLLDQVDRLVPDELTGLLVDPLTGALFDPETREPATPPPLGGDPGGRSDPLADVLDVLGIDR